MKKFFAAFMALILIFGLCACSEEGFIPERGKVENGIYNNAAFGVSFNGDAAWSYLADEEIAASMGVSEEGIPAPEDKKALSEAGIIYDMCCANSENGTTVNITYEDLSATYGEVIGADYYLELYQMEIDSQIRGEKISLEKNDIDFAYIDGKMYPCLKVAVNFDGTRIYETVIVKKSGNWLCTVTVAALGETELYDAVELISFE